MNWRDTLEAAERGEDVGVLPDDEEPASFIRGLIADRVEQLEARKSTEAQAQAFGGIATGRATPLRLYVDQWLAEGALRGVPLKERTKAERRRAVDKLAEWMVRTKIAATVEAVTRRVAGRYVSDELISSGRDPVTLGKSVRSLMSYWAWLQKRGRLPEEARNPWSGQAPQKRVNDFDLGNERAFTNAEVARLLASPPGNTLDDFMRVGALTGMRRGGKSASYRLPTAPMAYLSSNGARRPHPGGGCRSIRTWPISSPGAVAGSRPLPTSSTNWHPRTPSELTPLASCSPATAAASGYKMARPAGRWSIFTVGAVGLSPGPSMPVSQPTSLPSW